MSGFDGMIRSQQVVAQNTQFYDAQRYASMDRMGQTAMQIPGMVQELMHRKQDADMRLALQQQEYQSNAMKLEAMAAIDQADLMREQVRSAKLQNDAIEFDMQHKRDMLGQRQAESAEAFFGQFVRDLGGAYGAARAGLKIDIENRRVIPMTDEEFKSYQKQERAQSDITERRERRIQLAQMIKLAEEQGDYETKESLYEELRELVGGEQRQPRPQPPSPEQTAQREAIETRAREIAARIVPKKGSPPWVISEANLSEGDAYRVGQYFAEIKDKLHEHIRTRKPERTRKWLGETPDKTVDNIVNALIGFNQEDRNTVIQLLIDNGILTPPGAQGHGR
jgi:hypothetical protein